MTKKKLGIYVSENLASKLDTLADRLSHLTEVLDSPNFNLGENAISKFSKGYFIEAILEKGISATVDICKEVAGYNPLNEAEFREKLVELEREGRRPLPSQSDYSKAMVSILKETPSSSLTAKEMYKALEKHFNLTEAQLSYTVPSSNKKSAHENLAQWSRFELVKKGILDPNAGRGIWSLKNNKDSF